MSGQVARYCDRCARSGVGACDDFPNCPAGGPQINQVRTGQVWADNDIRSKGRTVKVESVDGEHAVCVVLTNTDDQQDVLDRYPGQRIQGYTDRRGRSTRIAVRRLLAGGSRGYRLVRGS